MTLEELDPLEVAANRRGTLPAATQRAFFGPLRTEDAPSAVVRRLRTAIGLGFLADGDKLPKEADLAKQLGVTAFALREALGVLRADGLIVTRAGKKGGSFVRCPVESESLAVEDLTRVSAAELRDLGDWRRMLTSQAASLAAQRASESTVSRLTACADQVAAAPTSHEARRALGRFNVELAAASQSIRISHAEIEMHEQFDWLVSFLLSDEQRRHDVAAGLQAIARAVRSQRPSAAQNAAGQLVSLLVTDLVRIRLSLIAQKHRGSSGPGTEDPSTFIEELHRFTSHVLNALIELGSDIAPYIATDTAAASDMRTDRAILSRLDQLVPIIHGIGIIADVDVVPGHKYWLDWWQRTEDGSFARDFGHVLNPAREDFYDYESMDYMEHPRKSLEPWATGPYVDHGGVDDYLMTIAVPLADSGEFRGIAAMDLRIANLEETFAPWLAQTEGAYMLLNSESRVILSSSIEYSVGDVIRSKAPLTFHDLGVFGWALASPGAQTSPSADRN